MARVGRLLVFVGGDAKALRKTFRGVERTLKSTADRISSIGRSLSIGISAPIAAAAAAVVKFGGDFDKALTKSTAIMGDLTDAVRNDLANAAKSLTKLTGPREAAESFFFLASAGLDAQQSIAALPQVVKFATAGQFDLARATDLATDAQSALGLSSKDAITTQKNLTRVTDVLVKANTLANASVEQFSEALTNKAGPQAKAFNISIEETVATLAAFADQGIKGSEAGTQFAIVVRDLTTKALQNADAFDRFGVSVFDSNENVRFLGDILLDLENALEGTSDATKKATLLQLGFADKSISALLALLGTSSKVRDYKRQLDAAGGTTDKVANKQVDNFIDKLADLGRRLQVSAIDLFEALQPLLADVIAILDDLVAIIEEGVGGFAELDTATKRVIVGGVALLAALGPVLVVVGGLVAAGGALVAAIGAISAAILPLTIIAATLVGILESIVAQFAIFETVKRNFRRFTETLRFTLEELGIDVDGLAKAFKEGFTAIRDTVRDLMGEARRVVVEVLGFIEREIKLRLGIIKGILRGISPAGAAAVDAGAAALERGASRAAVLDAERTQGVGPPAPPVAAEVGPPVPERILEADKKERERQAALSEVEEKRIKILKDLDDGLASVDRRERLYGSSIDLTVEKSDLHREAIRKLLDTGLSPASEKIQALSQNLFDNRSAWQVWAADIINVSREAANAIFDTFQGLAQGIGDAVAQALIYEQDFAKATLNVVKQVVAQLISEFISLTINFISQSLIRQSTVSAETATFVTAATTTAAAAAASESVKTFGLVGIALAAVFAAAAIAAVIAAATSAKSKSKGVTALAEGGVLTGPTVALLAEKHSARPEVALPLKKLQGMFSPELHFNVDGRDLTRALAPHFPDVLGFAGAS